MRKGRLNNSAAGLATSDHPLQTSCLRLLLHFLRFTRSSAPMTNPTFEDGFILFNEGKMIQASVQEVPESEEQLVRQEPWGIPNSGGVKHHPAPAAAKLKKLKAFFFSFFFLFSLLFQSICCGLTFLSSGFFFGFCFFPAVKLGPLERILPFF